MNIKKALERFEKASKFIDNASKHDQEKWKNEYIKAVDDIREAFDNHIKNELGYNPYENYEQLLKEVL